MLKKLKQWANRRVEKALLARLGQHMPTAEKPKMMFVPLITDLGPTLHWELEEIRQQAELAYKKALRKWEATNLQWELEKERLGKLLMKFLRKSRRGES